MKASKVARIVKVSALKGYSLRLTFADSAAKTVDLEPILWGPIFAPLRDKGEFKKVRVSPEFGCIEWPNGADLCPDALRRWRAPQRKTELPRKTSDRLGKLIARYNGVSEVRRQSIFEEISDILDTAKKHDKKAECTR